MQEKGMIIKGIAGFYYVELEDKRIIECKARGRFRNEKQSPIVGDKVLITVSERQENMEKGTIDEILPRKSELVRPLVANVDQAFIIFALKKPDINQQLLDKLLILTEYSDLDAIICFNKSDLDEDNLYATLKEEYEKIGYKVLKLNGKTGEGIEDIKMFAKNKISVFVGPSGVGKSTIFNQIQDKVSMKTGDISSKVDRGKHTTRHAELIEIFEGSFVVDTPGFSSMDIDFIKPEDLQYAFREFLSFVNKCKFTSCLHNKEIGCCIKEAVEEGRISQKRYDTYISLLQNTHYDSNFRRNKR